MASGTGHSCGKDPIMESVQEVAPPAPNTDLGYTLILVSSPRINERWDFDALAAAVQSCAPDIEVLVIEDRDRSLADSGRPTLTISPGPVRRFRPTRGPLLQGCALTKGSEYEALERLAVPIPGWALLTRDTVPDLSNFGSYVVCKPNRGGRGADIRVVRKERVRWRPPRTDFVRGMKNQAGGDQWIVQDFVYTGPYPVSYRVTTLFGEPLWAWKSEASHAREGLCHREDFGRGGVSIVSSGRGSANGKGCTFSVFDPPAEMLALAGRAHQAFPDLPLLGVDILADVDTGRLFVIEVNSVGFTWHLTSPIGLEIQRTFGFDLDQHFNVRERAARILATRVRQRATAVLNGVPHMGSPRASTAQGMEEIPSA